MEEPFLIAEIGINHSGDVEIAKKLIDNAIKNNWNAIKFQKRDVRTVIPKEMWHKPKDTPWGTMDYIDYKERLEFNEEDYDKINAYCKKKGIEWFASAWDMKSQEFLNMYDLKYNKIASAMITYQPLLDSVASERKMTFISTGMTEWEDIDNAVQTFRDGDCPFVLMHCVGLYPCPLDRLNMLKIKALRKRYKCEVGYSGHSQGALDAVIAATLGCRYIEKHITLDRAMFGSDQAASIEPDGMEFITKHTRHIPIMLGDGKYIVYDDEKKIAEKLRWW